MLCMVFGQLTARDSMRDLILSLEAHKSKYYHLGFGATVSRRNLGKANEKRNYKIFEEFACILIEEARSSCYKTDFEINVEGNVYAFDSSTIDLCLSVFWWAEFRKHKGGIKLHALYDVKTSIPLLRSGLKDTNAAVRKECSEAFAEHVGSKDDITLLKQCLDKEENEKIQMLLKKAIKRLENSTDS